MLFSCLAYADTCEVQRTKDVLRKNLYLYLTNPPSSPLTINELKDLLNFYLGISSNLITVDCSSIGSNSNNAISNIVNNGDNAPDIIPACSDSTKYGECSLARPKFCYGGSLIEKCSSCGCSSNTICQVNNSCKTASNITCSADVDCSKSQFTGTYYCINSSITRNYLHYTCLNAGTTNSSCFSSSSAINLTYCDQNLNQTCVNGQAYCNVPVQDTLAPTIIILAPNSSLNVSGMTNILANASDNIGVAAVQFALDSSNLGTEITSSPYSLPWDTTAVANGLHTLTASARDSSGNTATASVDLNVYNVLDNASPTVAIITPSNFQTVSGSAVAVSANASDNIAVVGVQFLLDGLNLSFEDTTSPYSISWDTTTASNGTHTISAKARDAAGNYGTSANVTVNVSNAAADTTAPNVAVTAPLSGSKVNGTVTVSANASDNVGIIGVQFLLDGSNLSSEDTTSPYSISWDTTAVANRNYTISAKARDFAGNYGTSLGITFNVSNPLPDTTPPTVVMTSPQANSKVVGIINVSANASDNVGVVGVQFKLNNSNLGAEDTISPYLITWNSTAVANGTYLFANGTYSLAAVARDAAGNTATASGILVNVSNFVCGNGVCEAGETHANCKADC